MRVCLEQSSVRSQTSDYPDENSKEKGLTKQLEYVTYDTNGNESERIIYNDYGSLLVKEVHITMLRIID